jgi:hypothetical protein
MSKMLNIANKKEILHVKQLLGHRHAQVQLEIFRGQSQMKNLGLKTSLEQTGILNFQRPTAARNKVSM